jgi:hypothetical protein
LKAFIDINLFITIDRLLTLNDLINSVLHRYENVKNGIFEKPEERPQQSSSAQTTQTT